MGKALVTHLAHAGPAAQIGGITAGGTENMARDEFPHRAHIGLGARGRVKRDTGLAPLRQAMDPQARLVDTDGQGLVGQQDVEPQAVLTREFDHGWG